MIETFYLENDVKKGKIEDIEKYSGRKVWVDITNITKEESEQIKEKFNLHPLTTEDLFSSNVRVKVEEFPSYLFSVFYAVRNSRPIELIELDFILGKDFLITNHKKEISSFETLKKDTEKLEKVFFKGVDFLFHKLLDMEVDNFMPALEKIDDIIEELEEEVTKKPTNKVLSKILRLKREIVRVKKITLPQREKISYLAKNDHKLFSRKVMPYLRDVYDHAVKVSDTIDNYREAVSNTYDVYMSAMSNSMNEVMKTLSIIATIALPLTVISGVYGTNFSVIPGSGFLYGFYVMIFFMVLLSLGMIYYFKKKGWF